jgi:uncharacterized protein (TIGR04141 family)
VPRQESTASKVSLYRLVESEDKAFTDYIQSKYLDNGFIRENVNIAGVSSELVSGVIPNPAPKWLPHVTALTGSTPDVHNDTSAAVLLIPLRNFVYALCWGFGHLIITPERIDSGFGLRFAIRRANPEQVRSLTIHTMDTLARTSRMTVPGGAALDAFGMEEVGEVISRLVGRIPATGLTADQVGSDHYLTVRGADGLGIPISRDPSGLLSDLNHIHDVIANEPPREGLEHFEHTRPLRPGDPVIEPLKGLLAESLTPGCTRLALSWPAEWEEEHGEADSYGISGLGRGEWEDNPDTLELDHLISPLAEKPVQSRLAALKRIRVQALDSDGNPISRSISADKWITFEVDFDQQRYIFHQGRWFNIGGIYLEMLREKVTRIFEQKSSVSLPAWPREEKRDKNGVKNGKIGPGGEGDYNIYAAEINESLVCLDRKLLRTTQHPRGMEACDLLGGQMELVHVKRMDDSVSASHLFNQALVSAEALKRQVDAKEQFQVEVRKQSKGAREIPSNFRPEKVVLAFGGREAKPDALFTFSQVTLVRCAQRLAELEISLEIAEIAESSEILPERAKNNKL